MRAEYREMLSNFMADAQKLMGSQSVADLMGLFTGVQSGVEEGEPVEDPPTYWLLESGWEWDDEPIRKKEALLRDIAGV